MLLAFLIASFTVLVETQPLYVYADELYLVNIGTTQYPILHNHIGSHSSYGGCYCSTVYHEHHSGNKVYSFGDGTSYTEGACNTKEVSCVSNTGNRDWSDPCGCTHTEHYWHCSKCGRNFSSTTNSNAGCTNVPKDRQSDSGNGDCHSDTVWDCGKSIVGYGKSCGHAPGEEIAWANAMLDEATGEMVFTLTSTNQKSGTSATWTIQPMTMEETNQGSAITKAGNVSRLGIETPKYKVTVNFTEAQGQANSGSIPIYIASIFNMRYQTDSQKPLVVYLDGIKLRAVYYGHDNNLSEMFARNRDYLVFGY